MGEVKTEPVEAKLVDSIVSDDAPAGAIKFYADRGANPAGFHFQCPCGCRRVGAVDFKIWTWNGSREKPTVRASVDLKDETGGASHWHGFLTDGVWESC